MADEPTSFWRRNRGARLAALVLATIVWYVIREATSYDTVIEDVPIIIQRDEGIALLDLSDETTDVRLSGTRTDLRDLTRAQVQVVVDVRGRTVSGPITLQISPSHVRAPRGVRPVWVRVNQLSFSLDREVEKLVPVKVVTQGAPPPGYEVERFLCEPAVVRVRGPSSRLESVDSVRTSPIDLEGRIQPFKTRVGVSAMTPGWAARIDPDRVMVEVLIIEQSAMRVLSAVPVKVLAEPAARIVGSLSPAAVEVTIQGHAEGVASVGAESLIAFVEVPRGAVGRYELPVRIYTAAPVRVVAVSPGSVLWNGEKENSP